MGYGMIAFLRCCPISINKGTKLRVFSPQANYTDEATAACQRKSN
jgi:hypothetical protein